MIEEKKGFTLIELLVIMAIIGILATISFVLGSSARKKAKINTAKNDLRAYGVNIMNYHNKHISDFPLTKRWPDKTDVTICDFVVIKYRVPNDLKNEGLGMGNNCMPYQYVTIMNQQPLSAIGREYVIAVVWSGLDGKFNLTSTSGGRDNYVLIVDYNCRINAGIKCTANDAKRVLSGTVAVGGLSGQNWKWDTNNTLFSQ